MSEMARQDIQALAKGGRTNFFGFLLRLLGTAPFLFIAGQKYGVERAGVYASALVIVELAAQLCALGQRRGLAQRLSEDDREQAAVVADGLLLTLMLSGGIALALYLVPAPMFPSGTLSEFDRLMPLAIVPNALTEVALAALAYNYNIGATVRARSLVEPWIQTLAALAFLYLEPDGGLILSYILAKYAAAFTAFVPMVRLLGVPRHWHPHPLRIGRLAVLSQSRTAPRLAMKVPAAAFTPPPKVDSGVVHFEPLPTDAMFAELDALEAVTAAAFGQRRKMLRQSLKSLAGRIGLGAADFAESAGIDPTARPEEIAPTAFQRLALVYASRRPIAAANAEMPV